MRHAKQIIFLILLCSFCKWSVANIEAKGGKETMYKDKNASIEDRVEDLLSRMTLKEKLTMLGGTGFTTQPIKRLGIPPLNMTDGPLGVRWDKSTAFPAGIALASSWDPEIADKVGKAIAIEVKAEGRQVILGPCVNIARIPMGGRNFESYGEDPFLASQMAVGYIDGVQKENVVATVKHFAANNQEYERMFVNVIASKRTLNEIYLPAFKAAVKDANVLAVMSAYNKINGHYCSENDFLLIDKLKKEWGFQGLVMSDWGAVHSTLPTVNGGLDLEMPTGEFLKVDDLEQAIKDGKVAESTVDDKIRRILRVMFKIGLFDNYPKPDTTKIADKENRATALEAAEAGIVLLKNDDNILPLDSKKIKTIAVIGPNSDVARTGGGGSSRVEAAYSVTPLDALKKKLGKDIKINFVKGIASLGDVTPIDPAYLYLDKDGKTHGLHADFYNNMDLAGEPVLSKTIDNINFNWSEGSPGPKLGEDSFSLRCTGYLKAPSTGKFTIDAVSDDGVRVFFEGEKVLENWTDHAPEKVSVTKDLEAGKLYKVVVEYYEHTGGAELRLGWGLPGSDVFAKAVEAAKKADCVILFTGTSENIESEGYDRFDIKLPAQQDKLIKEVAAANKNTIVVVTSGSPVLMNEWNNDVKAIMESWFAGSEIGNAITAVLTGDYNPSGKLPITFPQKWEDCSAYKTYKAVDSTTYYDDGIYVGYRHFDKYKIKPLYPFGYGLSYTQYEYKDLKINDAGNGEFTVTFDITNTGKRKGAEIAQLYISAVDSKVDRPEKELKGFTKISLNPGETKTASIKLNKSQLAYYSEDLDKWVVEPGKYKIIIGASSADPKLSDSVVIE